MPESKQEYFAISAERTLPNHCPILERCERRAHTIALANGWPLREAASRVGLETPIVKSVGEPASKIGGTGNFVFGGQCPEVNLFETTFALPGFSGKPTTKGQYDKYLDPQMEVLETGHHSWCAEQATSEPADVDSIRRSWIRVNYQWLIGTLVALLSAAAAFLAIK